MTTRGSFDDHQPCQARPPFYQRHPPLLRLPITSSVSASTPQQPEPNRVPAATRFQLAPCIRGQAIWRPNCTYLRARTATPTSPCMRVVSTHAVCYAHGQIRHVSMDIMHAHNVIRAGMPASAISVPSAQASDSQPVAPLSHVSRKKVVRRQRCPESCHIAQEGSGRDRCAMRCRAKSHAKASLAAEGAGDGARPTQ